MTKGTIPIRETKLGQGTEQSLALEDYSYRAIGKRIAEEYVDKNYQQDHEISNRMWNLLYFILGAFVWEFIPVFSEGVIWVWKVVLPFLMIF